MNISGDYKAGEITINEDYVILYGKGEYYGNLMDEDINIITDKIHADDIPNLKYAIEQLAVQEVSAASIRIEGEDGYNWVVAMMSYSDFEDKGRKLIDISLQNIIWKRDEGTRFYHTLIDEDPGTGLLNKRAVTDYVKKLIDEDKVDSNVTIAIIDIDDFKTINDTYGHSFGDEVLLKIAKIVRDAVGEKGVAGRIGGDEMFIVLLGMENEDQIRSVLRTIKTNVGQEEYNGKKGVITTCSIGSATYPLDASSYADLFNIADKLLYLAKEKGKNRYIIYEDDIHRQYVKGTGDAVMRVKAALKYNKRSVILELIERFLVDDTLSFEDMCESVGPSFELEDISVYRAGGWEKIKAWGIFKDCSLDIPYADNPDYIVNFDKYNIFSIDGPIWVRAKCEQLYKVLSKQKISASVHYLVGSREEPRGIITYNKSRLAKKWASWDIDWLCILSRMIELKVFGK